MRAEETIRKLIDKRRKSIYRRFYDAEIGTLLWVLGEANSPQNGRKKEAELRIKESEGV